VRVPPWILAALLGACALGGCEDDNAYKTGKPFQTTGGPMDGRGDGATDAPPDATGGADGGGGAGGSGGAGGTAGPDGGQD
jgi:hypothetical protein